MGAIKAHYVPATYLGNFANPSTEAPRSERLWVIGRTFGALKDPQKTEAIACSRHMYSRIAPDEAEAYFNYYEVDLRSLVEDAAKLSSFPNNPKRSSVGIMMLHHALIMRVRNPSNNVMGDAERIDLVKHFAEIGHRKLILGQEDDETDARSAVARILGAAYSDVARSWNGDGKLYLMRQAVSTRWNWRVLHTQKRAQLITSDNPACLFYLDKSCTQPLLMMPLTPTQLFVAVTTNAALVENRAISPQLVRSINGIITKSAYNAIYGAEPFGSEDIKAAISIFERNLPVESTMADGSWNFSPQVFRDPSSLPFLRLRPAQLPQ